LLQQRTPTTPLPDAILAQARARLERPTPRVALGQALRGIATAAADISDGLQGDLGHILERSGVGATLETDVALQLPAAFAALAAKVTPADRAAFDRAMLGHVLSGGDDYELVFTAPVQQAAAVQAAARQSGTPVTRIGRIEAQPGLRLLDGKGQALQLQLQSFDHFSAAG
jgi:thiamine-monophosphate kinase